MSPAVWLALMLSFSFPRSYQPQPDRFVIQYAHTDGSPAEAMSVPPSSVAACADLAGATSDTYCAEWPTCPEAGQVLVFAVHAAWGEDVSAESETVLCYFEAGAPCRCLSQAEVSSPPPAAAADPVPAPTPTLASASVQPTTSDTGTAPEPVTLPPPVLPMNDPLRNAGPGFRLPTIPVMPPLPALGPT